MKRVVAKMIVRFEEIQIVNMHEFVSFFVRTKFDRE